MRQQHNGGRRSRNRPNNNTGGTNTNNNNSNNNRRNQNPLQRSYESNGPDIKIRGNAQVIADKYTQLARDAQASGDIVMAENYLQHAEHYNRIILAAMPAPRDDVDDGDDNQNNNQNNNNDAEDDEREYDAEPADQRVRGDRNREERNRDNRNNGNNGNNGNQQRRNDQRPHADQVAATAPVSGDDPQPVIEGTPAEVAREVEERSNDDTRARRSRTRRPRPRDDEEGANAVPVAEALAEPAAEPADVAPARAKPVRKSKPVAAEDAPAETKADGDDEAMVAAE